ncbi:MAG: hypothetical protein HY608_10770, partial [Planctomycetes bacterium]|nr:hypothetical protein [Planctomycetota bacterium]
MRRRVVRYAGSRRRHNQTGSVMMVALVAMIGLSAACLAYYGLTTTQMNENAGREYTQRALWLAEAGVSAAIQDLNGGGEGNLSADLGDGTYETVVVDNGDGTSTLTSTGTYQGTFRVLETNIEPTTSSVFTHSLFSDETLTLNGNILTDSYDSSLGTYASQATNTISWGGGSFSYANANGDAGSNDSIDINGSTAVMGDAVAGPDGSVDLNGNVHVEGLVENLTTTTELEPVTITYPSSNDNANVGVSGVDKLQTNNSDVTMSGGIYHLTQIKVNGNGNILITGDSTLYLTEGMQVNGNGQLLISPGVKVTIYTAGKIHINGNSFVNADQQATDLTIYSSVVGSGSGSAVHINGNADFSGAIYAPT